MRLPGDMGSLLVSGFSTAAPPGPVFHLFHTFLFEVSRYVLGDQTHLLKPYSPNQPRICLNHIPRAFPMVMGTLWGSVVQSCQDWKGKTPATPELQFVLLSSLELASVMLELLGQPAPQTGLTKAAMLHDHTWWDFFYFLKRVWIWSWLYREEQIWL